MHQVQRHQRISFSGTVAGDWLATRELTVASDGGTASVVGYVGKRRNDRVRAMICVLERSEGRVDE